MAAMKKDVKQKTNALNSFRGNESCRTELKSKRVLAVSRDHSLLQQHLALGSTWKEPCLADKCSRSHKPVAPMEQSLLQVNQSSDRSSHQPIQRDHSLLQVSSDII